MASTLWHKRVLKTEGALNILQCLPEAHAQFCLLRQCLSACRVNDLLRSTPIDWAVPECARLQVALRHHLDGILGYPTTAVQWQQSALAVRCGGLGVADPVMLRPAARLACTVHFLQHVQSVLGFSADLNIVPRDVSITLPLLQTQLGDIQFIRKWVSELRE